MQENLSTSNCEEPPFLRVKGVGPVEQTNARISEGTLALAAVFLFALIKLIVIATTPLGLAPDEAHYWDWSRQLDWAYYSKGPVVAYLIWFGRIVFGDTVYAVRIPALVCATLFFIVFYQLLVKIADSRSALVGLLLIQSSLFFHTLGLGMSTDTPCLLFWTMALLSGVSALESNNQKHWLFFGASVGLAILSKYTAFILWPAVILYLSIKRRWDILFSRAFLGGTLLLGFMLTPIAIWNLGNDWVNVAHNTGHIISQHGFKLTLRYLPEVMGGQFGLIGPVLLPMLIAAGMMTLTNRSQKQSEAIMFIAITALPLLTVCAGVTLSKRMYPNWSMPLTIHGIAILTVYLSSAKTSAWWQSRRWVRRALYTNVALLLIVYPVAFGWTYGIPANRIASKKLIGWETLGNRVEEELTNLQERGQGTRPFVLSDGYGEASEIAFYTASHPFVLCLNNGSRRMNQFDVWGGWESKKGSDSLIVTQSKELPSSIATQFKSVTPLGIPLTIVHAGDVVRTFYFYFGARFSGAPPPQPSVY